MMSFLWSMRVVTMTKWSQFVKVAINRLSPAPCKGECDVSTKHELRDQPLVV